MALTIYDSDKVAYSTPVRTHHDGRLGGAHEELLYIKNGDAGKYYTSVRVNYAHSLPTLGSWSIKFIAGERRPTEAEWDVAENGIPITLVDIGDTGAADTSTYLPFWVRVYAPGNSAASKRASQNIVVSAYERLVGT